MKKKTRRKKKAAVVYLRLSEVARRLDVHRQSVSRDVKNNYLKAVEFAGIPLVTESEFKKYAVYVSQRKPRRYKKKD